MEECDESRRPSKGFRTSRADAADEQAQAQGEEKRGRPTMATLREEMRREPRLIDWDYVHRHRNEAPPSEKVHFNFMDGQSGSTTLHLSSYGGDLAMAEWA